MSISDTFNGDSPVDKQAQPRKDLYAEANEAIRDFLKDSRIESLEDEIAVAQAAGDKKRAQRLARRLALRQLGAEQQEQMRQQELIERRLQLQRAEEEKQARRAEELKQQHIAEEKARAQIAEQQRIEAERQEQYRQKTAVLKTHDSKLSGWVNALDAFTNGHGDLHEIYATRTQGSAKDVVARLPFLELPATIAYRLDLSAADAHQLISTMPEMPYFDRAHASQESARGHVLLWGDDRGDISRRITTHEAHADLDDNVCVDETYVGGQRRHYALYTMTGRLIQEVYFDQGQVRVFKPGLLDRISGAVATAFGVMQERPEQPMLRELRTQNALSSIAALLDRAAPDVALTVLSATLSSRALLSGDDSARQTLDQVLQDTIVPSYTRRVELARNLAAAHSAFDTAIADIAGQRDAMAMLPLAQNALDQIIATAVEDKDRHKLIIASARTLLESDDIRQPESRQLGKDLDAEFEKIRSNPQLVDAVYRMMHKRYETLLMRPDNAAALEDATTALQGLAARAQSDLAAYLESISDQVNTAKIYLKSKNGLNASPLLSPITDVPLSAPGSKRK